MNERGLRYSLIFIFLWVAWIEPAIPSEFFTIDEYLTRHPGQAPVMQEFSTIVKAEGKPVSGGGNRSPVRISFIYPGEQVSDYWRRSILSFKARMDEIGVNYTINEFFSKPVVDYRIQERQIKKALIEDPDYLVFTLDVKKHKRMIERIILKRRPKVILQNITTPLKIWEGKQPFLYVGFDHERGSTLLADWLMDRVGPVGEYAMLYFSKGYVSEMRGDKFIDYLKGRSKLSLVASFFTDGNRQKAALASSEIVKNYPQLKFIFSCSTDVALGAIDTLSESAGPRTILVNGWGGGSSELGAMENGQMDVTVMRMNDDNGVAMAEAIRMDIHGEAHRVPIVFSGDFAVIEKEIRPEELKALKKRAFRYSGLESLERQ